MPDPTRSPQRLTKTPRLPKYRHQKSRNLAVVRLNGKDHYLGAYGSPESREEYDRVVGEWLLVRTTPVPQGQLDTSAGPGPTINEIILAFLNHAESHYRREDGSSTGEAKNFEDAVRPLRRLYGRTPAKDFGPLKLKVVRTAMIKSGLSRKTINARVGKLVRMFKWAVGEELVPASVHHGLKAVAGLEKGRSSAPESEPVKPVPEAYVEAIRPFVSRQVWTMVQLQRLTGMRPGEVTIMRTGDLDMTGKLWEYIPNRHKTEHHGRERRIPLGPKAQAILKLWLRTDLTAYLFSPREAAEARWEEQRQGRKSPMTPSQSARKRKRKPRRAPGASYDTRAYAHAIHKGCRKADVPIWGPNRLRHSAATVIRKEFGLEVARAVLGHAKADTTEIYAERDASLAAEAMERIG